MSTLSEIYNEISEVAGLLHQKGWAEKNAGNFSIRIDDNIELEFSDNQLPLPTSYPHLTDRVFLVTGKGKRMRDIAKSASENTVILKVNSTGDRISIHKGKQIIPTSELPTHLAIHNMIAQRGSNEKTVIHTHVTELIALTHIKKYCDQNNLNNLLWKMHPETIMFIPDGVGFVPFNLPGSNEIATETAKALKSHPIVIWEKHGVFSIASNHNDCYDLIDIVAKSAKIYFLGANTGNLPQGLSKEQLDELKDIEF